MFLWRAILRLRAAHGLAFAIAAGQRPNWADVEAAGLGGVASEQLGNRIEGGKALRAEIPKATENPLPPDLTAARNRYLTTEAA